jgi:hypothetical protein
MSLKNKLKNNELSSSYKIILFSSIKFYKKFDTMLPIN